MRKFSSLPRGPLFSWEVSITRCKIAWGKINPKLRCLAEEDYNKREDNLFGPGFIELASKYLEIDKTMSKVSATPPPPAKRFKYSNDRSDLRSFLAKDPHTRYGSREGGHTIPEG
jgi:hypothetical protein